MLPRWSLLHADTLKRFAAEMMVIVLGILVALYFDGLVEQRKERKLVTEAKSAVGKELAENRRELADVMAENVESRKKIVASIASIDKVLKNESTKVDLSWSASTAELGAAAWLTAQQSGALAHMTYAEITRFNDLYERQRDYLRQQERLSDHVLVAVGRLDTIKDTETTWSRDVLSSMRALLVTALQQLSVVQTLGQAMLKSYDRALGSAGAA